MLLAFHLPVAFLYCFAIRLGGGADLTVNLGHPWRVFPLFVYHNPDLLIEKMWCLFHMGLEFCGASAGRILSLIHI